MKRVIKFLTSNRRACVKFAITIILGICLVLASYSYGYRRGESQGESRALKSMVSYADVDSSSYAPNEQNGKLDFSPFWHAWTALDANFAPYDKSQRNIKNVKHLQGAIAGVVSTYNDPFTAFIPTEQAEEFKQSVNGAYEGVGIVFAPVDGRIVATEIMAGSPAEKAKIAPLSTLIKVNGQSILGTPLDRVSRAIKGKKGTIVGLTFLPPGSQVEKLYTITRDVVTIPTVATQVKTKVETVVEQVATTVRDAMGVAKTVFVPQEKQVVRNYFVLNLSTFSASSIQGFISELGKFAESDSRGIIIDLRNNPGGYIEVAVDLASYFLPEGAVVVREAMGRELREVLHKSRGYGLLRDSLKSKKVVILVNRNSASASEIMAGALQDHRVATVMGEQTYGKGSAQNLIDIDDVGTLKVTISRWFTPNGRGIDGRGLTPDLIYDANDPKYKKYSTDPDPLMSAAIDRVSK